ncbi:MAG: uroporphyrinogen decarboxylase family protein [Armatimonadota bacterium]
MTTDTVTTRKQRWLQAYAQQEGPGRLFLINYEPDALTRPFPWPTNIPERIDYSTQFYERALARAAWLDDDNLPHLPVFTGTEIFAEAFGCQIHRPDDNMPFALPLIHDASEVSRLRVPEISSTPLAMLFDIADELRRRGGSDALLQVIDLQSPLDISALIWDKNDFYAAFVEAPEAVKELAGKVTELLTAFLDAWFARYGKEFIAHYPAYYMPAGITLSVDEVGVFNTAMFEEFFLPELAGLSERYGAIGIHCCANSRHQWENFLRVPNLRVLNICQPEEVTRESWAYFASHLWQMPCRAETGPAATWPDQYPANACMIMEIPATTKEDALEIVERLR